MKATEAEIVQAMADELNIDIWQAAAAWLNVVRAIYRQRAEATREFDDSVTVVVRKAA